MKYIYLIILLVLITLPILNANVLYDNPNLPRVIVPEVTGNISWNQSLADSIYLLLNGSNANQDIDIGAYDLTTTGDISAQDIVARASMQTPIIYFDNLQNNIWDDGDVLRVQSPDSVVIGVGIGAGTYTFGINDLNLLNDNLQTTGFTNASDVYATDDVIVGDDITMGGGINGLGISSSASHMDITLPTWGAFVFDDIIQGVLWQISDGVVGGLALSVSGDSAIDQDVTTTGSPTFGNVTVDDIVAGGKITSTERLTVGDDLYINGNEIILASVNSYIEGSNAGTMKVTFRNYGAGIMNVDISPDESVVSQIGKVHLGIMAGSGGWEDYASMSHVDHDSTTGYSWVQTDAGYTLINSATGRYTSFRVGNVEKMRLDSSSLRVYTDVNITSGNSLTMDDGFTGDCVNASFVGGIATGCND